MLQIHREQQRSSQTASQKYHDKPWDAVILLIMATVVALIAVLVSVSGILGEFSVLGTYGPLSVSNPAI